MTDLVPTTLVHDKDMAREFLAGLDPAASRFTFQFFSDGPDKYAEIFHGTLDEGWPKVQALNTPERRVGAFVTVNETDFKGRRRENIVRPRALFADADSEEQITRCIEAIEACGAVPSMIVKSGRGLHFYWICPDIPLDQFSPLQNSLIDKLGTDAAITDLPRVMRLPGTLHLKHPTNPQFVKLCGEKGHPIRRWNFSELVESLKLSSAEPTTKQDKRDIFGLTPAERGRYLKLFGDLPDESLSEGLETDIEEIRSAALAIPASAISTEPKWMDLARAFAHEAALFPKQTEPLYEILGTASLKEPHYDQEDNRRRFERYISEAFNHEKPITIATVFHLAQVHGWQGWSPSLVTSADTSSSEVRSVDQQSTSPAEPSFVDPYADFTGPEFPLDVLPPTLARFVEAEHRAMGADPSALAMAALTAVAGAIHAETLLCAGEGWWERPILWTLLIGPPSAMKSPIIQKTIKPLSHIDHERHKVWQQEYEKWKQTPRRRRPLRFCPEGRAAQS
jgi:Protein of unknown function (DUF3987)